VRAAPTLEDLAARAGVSRATASRVLRGEIRALPDLLPDLTYSMLLPYVGAEAALTERRRLESGASATS